MRPRLLLGAVVLSLLAIAAPATAAPYALAPPQVTVAAPTQSFSGACGPGSVYTLVLNGTVNPEGIPVEVHFDYGRTTAYGQSTPAQQVGAGDTTVAVSASLTNVFPEHYRVVATSSAGTVTSADETVPVEFPDCPYVPPAPERPTASDPTHSAPCTAHDRLGITLSGTVQANDDAFTAYLWWSRFPLTGSSVPPPRSASSVPVAAGMPTVRVSRSFRGVPSQFYYALSAGGTDVSETSPYRFAPLKCAPALSATRSPRGAVRLALRCAPDGNCAGTVSLASNRRRLARRSYHLRGGSTRKLVLAVPRAARCDRVRLRLIANTQHPRVITRYLAARCPRRSG